jgi:hypothetical protein
MFSAFQQRYSKRATERTANRTNNQNQLLLRGTSYRLRLPLQVHQHALGVKSICTRASTSGAQALACTPTLGIVPGVLSECTMVSRIFRPCALQAGVSPEGPIVRRIFRPDAPRLLPKVRVSCVPTQNVVDCGRL